MPLPEQTMWDTLRPILQPLDPVRIESHMTSGVPDVNYTQGWIELKYAHRWPPRGGPLRVDHFTREQRGWLIRRAQAKGRVFLLLKVGEKEWLLFDGLTAALALGKTPQAGLYEKCKARWLRLPRTEEICPCLLR